MKRGGYERHGATHTKMYRLWYSMIYRCSDSRATAYESYGGRGIKVCERWQTFSNFLADMGERPEGMSLDRIDPNGNYEPRNCRWVPLKHQSNNRRNNVMLTFNGRTQAIGMWALELGISVITIKTRLNRGASPEAALQPVSKSRRPAMRIAPPG